MHVDITRLRGKIVECGMTQEKMAQKLGMNKSTLSRKMKSNAVAFSVGEMFQIAEILRLTNREAAEIFLAENSHYCESGAERQQHAV